MVAKSPARQAGVRARSTARKAGPVGVAKPKPQRQSAAQAAPAAEQAGTNGKPDRPPTPFEARLYAVIKCIPAGRVCTYGVLAQVLNSAPRACGQALRRNPFAPVVPCHRVIAASLSLGGFSGSWGIGCANVQKKKRLLAEEGVQFDDKGRLEKASGGAVMSAQEVKNAAAGVL